MSLPPFPADWVDLPDEQIGEALLNCWVGYQVATKCIRPEDTATDLATKILFATSSMETSAAKHAALQNALRLAVFGKFAEAGRLTRSLLQDGAFVMCLKKWARAGAKHSQEQTRKSKLPRGKVSDDGQTIGQIIERIVFDEPGHSAKELWQKFIGELDHLDIERKEVPHQTDLKKSRIEYTNAKGDLKSITFGRFEGQVTEYRSKEKSR